MTGGSARAGGGNMGQHDQQDEQPILGGPLLVFVFESLRFCFRTIRPGLRIRKATRKGPEKFQRAHSAERVGRSCHLVCRTR